MVLVAGMLAPAVAETPLKAPTAAPAAACPAQGTCPFAQSRVEAPTAAPSSDADSRLVARVFQVADLIIPVEMTPRLFSLHLQASPFTQATPCIAPKSQAVLCQRLPKTMERELIKMITCSIKPESWSEMGGLGTIDYTPVGMALVVNQTPDIQEQVTELLGALRRLTEVEVAIEVCFIKAPAALVDSLGLATLTKKNENPAKEATPRTSYEPTRSTVFHDQKVSRLLEVLQRDPRTNVMQAPKITLFNGQSGTLNLIDGDGVMATPKPKTIPIGTVLWVQPIVSADRREVQVNLQVELSTAASALVPVMTLITPKEANGGDGKPVVFTQYLESPAINNQLIDTTLQIPDGGTAVITGPKARNTGREAEYHLVLVTPRVLLSEPTEANAVGSAPVPQPRPVEASTFEEERLPFPTETTEPPQTKLSPNKQKKVARLVEQYHQACVEGRLDDAKKLARKALAIDPACFCDHN
jgi:hypothetical protein